nr:reverse transcriptase domain-containing protein [Tanacetum cinerariifolium]
MPRFYSGLATKHLFALLHSLRNEAVFIGKKTQRSVGVVSVVPDISGSRHAYKGPPSRLRSCFCLFVGKVVYEKLEWWFEQDIDDEGEEEDEEDGEKLEWWFEQDIDDEGEEDEEDGDAEPMWAADCVVALTPGSAITILETANEFAIKEKQKHGWTNIMKELSKRGMNFELLSLAYSFPQEILKNCHGHKLSKGNIIKIFYHGLSEITQEVLNAAAGGSKIPHSIEGTLLEEEIFSEFNEFMAMTADENSESESNTEEPPLEKITINTDYKIKTSLKEPPTDLELKTLPDNLEYVFLEEPSFLPREGGGGNGKNGGEVWPTVGESSGGDVPAEANAFGLCNAPATFQRCMLAFFHDMIEESVEVFMDDFSIYGDTFDKCLNNLDKMLQRCKDAHLVLNWEKCHFMVKEGIVLRHKVSGTRLEVDKAKIDVILKFPPLLTSKVEKNILTEYMILSGADNHPPMLDKDLEKNILTEYMILSGADNHPPMLDKDLYDLWKSRMKLYMQNREHGRMILNSVENGQFIWPTIEENGGENSNNKYLSIVVESLETNCASSETRNMNPIAIQQAALDNALVPFEKRLKIERCNARIDFTKPEKEETYQVTLEALNYGNLQSLGFLKLNLLFIAPCIKD